MRPTPSYCLLLMLLGTLCSCEGPSPVTPDAPTPAADGGGAVGDAGGDVDGGMDEPDAPLLVSPRLVDLSAGAGATCAVTAEGTVRCWGDNRAGQLGSGTTVERSVRPLEVLGIGDAVEVSVGYEYACVRHRAGTVSCWGGGSNGRLGDGTTEDHPTPIPVTGLDGVIEIEAGLYVTCALRNDGTEWCWGRSADIGNGFAGSMVPVQVVGLAGVAHIALAPNAGTGTNSTQSCGVRDDGSAYCWGPNDYGQLGTGDQSPARSPVAVEAITLVSAISPGGDHACALSSAGAFCWGFPGAVGDGNVSENRFSPVPVTTSETFIAIDAGDEHTCAIDGAGAVHCWGNCGRGQCGDGSVLGGSHMLTTPVRTAGIHDAELISSGANHSCAYTSSGTTLCWGDTTYGQLGSGTASTLERVNTPTPVVW